MLKSFRSKKLGGFTLIELLVVISIIAVLMAIMMPALRSARMQAQSLVCRTQLRDIGNAIRLYIADNNGKLPSSAASPSETVGYSDQRHADSQHRWYSRINKYYNKTSEGTGQSALEAYDFDHYRCPSMQKKWKGEGGSGIYGYNKFFVYPKDYSNSAYRNFSWRRESAIQTPADFPLMADLSAEDPLGLRLNDERGGVVMGTSNPHPEAYKYGWMGGNSAVSQHDYWGPAPNHGNSKCNFLFGDGHVEAKEICKQNVWPWLGEDRHSQTSGNAFHPRRNVSITPPK